MENIQLWIIGGLLAFVIGLIHALNRKSRKPSTEANLDSLRDLSTDTAIKQGKGVKSALDSGPLLLLPSERVPHCPGPPPAHTLRRLLKGT